MALFDRNNNRGYGYGPDQNRGGGFIDRAKNAVRGGWDRVENTFEGQGGRNDYGVGNDHLRQDYENRSTMDTGTGYGGGMNRGWNAGGTGYSNNARPMDRDGGLHQRNSWSDGAWTADAGERADREWNTGNRGRMGYDRDMNDTSPFQAGWHAGGMHGGMQNNSNLSGGTGMDRGGMDRDRGWNLGGGLGEWGHTGNMAGGANRYDRGYSAGGNRGGGFLDRAQNAVRRGWDNIEDRFDRDDNDRHLGGGAMRGGSSWAGNYDREFRGEGHYGPTHSPGMMGGMTGGGMNRYGSDYRAGGDMGRGDYDRGYKTREQTDAGDPFGDRANHTPIRMTGGNMGNRGNLGRYDENYRGNNRDWF